MSDAEQHWVWEPLGPDVPLGAIAEQDRYHVNGRNPFDPEAWEAIGFTRNWGDAAVMSPYFEVLRREVPGGNGAGTEFVVLCPTFLRRPLRFYFGGAWGSY